MMASVALMSWLWTTHDVIIPSLHGTLNTEVLMNVIGQQLSAFSDWRLLAAIVSFFFI